MMNISDKKILSQEYFAHESRLKEKFEYNRKHDEKRLRVLHDHDRLLENRKLTTIEHEKITKQNLVAMDKDLDQKMEFVKKSLGINII
ncbi:MAG: hypothetical protein PHY93_00360 [Bacteriovorax sp.]|nr:hypothetical protein [Bacteriovorax sp.]